VANEEQARYWGDEGGPRWVASEADYDLMLEPFGAAVVEALAPQPGEQVLDVGAVASGDDRGRGAGGRAERPSGQDRHLRADDRAGPGPAGPVGERTAPVELVVGDAADHDLRGPHDAVVSRFG
jgi:hypothetical protein